MTHWYLLVTVQNILIAVVQQELVLSALGSVS